MYILSTQIMSKMLLKTFIQWIKFVHNKIIIAVVGDYVLLVVALYIKASGGILNPTGLHPCAGAV